jgi:hypothetical protein
MASYLHGVTAAEMAEKAGCSSAAAFFTLNHLVLAGEAVKTSGVGKLTRFHSDVYANVPNCKLIRFADMPEEREASMGEVESIVLAIQGQMLTQYPASVFGDPGRLISQIIVKTCMRIIKGLKEIT